VDGKPIDKGENLAQLITFHCGMQIILYSEVLLVVSSERSFIIIKTRHQVVSVLWIIREKVNKRVALKAEPAPP
jgi:hypothetical protein